MPQLLSLGTATTETTQGNYQSLRVLQSMLGSEKPLQRAAHALQLRGAPGLTATREKPAPQRRPNTGKDKKTELYIIKVTSSI